MQNKAEIKISQRMTWINVNIKADVDTLQDNFNKEGHHLFNWRHY